MPIQIQPRPSDPTAGVPPLAAADKRAAVSETSAFGAQLHSAQGSASEQRMRDLAAAIDEQGRVLLQRADIAEFQKYRQLLSDLISEAQSAYSFTTKSQFDARGRHREYSIVRRINTQLEDLAGRILGGQADNLQLAAAVDDIRGLVLDLLT